MEGIPRPTKPFTLEEVLELMMSECAKCKGRVFALIVLGHGLLEDFANTACVLAAKCVRCQHELLELPEDLKS